MVVDDNRKVLEALRLDLMDRGANVTVFSTAHEALTFSNKGLVIDVAIIDYDLGDDITGIELYRRLRREGKTFSALILTGRTDTLTLSDIRDSGIPWMSKPANPDTLASVIGRLPATAAFANHTAVPIQ